MQTGEEETSVLFLIQTLKYLFLKLMSPVLICEMKFLDHLVEWFKILYLDRLARAASI